jgi:hypothetical protein
MAESRRTTSNLPVAVAAAVIAVVLVGRLIIGADGDPTALMAFGETSTSITDHVERVLAREVVTREELGHDGRFFFLQALDPLYVGAEDHWRELDRPAYRAQRMAYPAIAGGLGLLPVGAVPWGLIATNVAAMVLGTVGTARLAVGSDRSPWWGLAFTLNLGLIQELEISGAGILAFAAAVWAFGELERDRPRSAAGWLVLSALAREVMLVAAVGVFALDRLRRSRWSWGLVVAPGLAVVAWAAYLRLQLEATGVIQDVQEIGWPFAGMFDALPALRSEPVHLIVGLVYVVVMAWFSLRAFRSRTYLTWGTIGFVPLSLLLTEQVWRNFFDIGRAIAPVLTAFVFAVYVERRAPAVEPKT